MPEADRAEIDIRSDDYFAMIEALEDGMRAIALPSPAPRPAAFSKRPVVAPGMAIAAGALLLAGAAAATGHFPAL